MIINDITYVWVKVTREQVPRNQMYLTTRAGAKNSKCLLLNGNISPENMGMDLMILKV